MSFQRKKILVCPLNWGLGHAARDVVIIQRLLDLGHQVVIAGDGAALDLLRQEFTQLEILRFPSVIRIRYSLILPAWLKITLLSPFLLYEILSEHLRLVSIIKKIGPDIVISDNRYGLWNRRVKSILITHQLNIRLPGFLRIFEYPLSLAIKIFIRKFDQCWIPDYPGGSNLSGELSHRYKLPQNAVFIGAISRFEKKSMGESMVLAPDLLILLSGPEPQRSRLQKTLLKQVLSLELSCVILQGVPGKAKRTDLSSRVTMYKHLGTSELKNILISARYIICRSGYTGIMDLALLRKKALIIPTPGQTEQEYFSEYLAGKGMFLTCGQDELNLESAINDLADFNPVFNLPSEDLLGNEIANLSL